MEIIIDYLRQGYAIIGLIFIVIGVIVGVFKQHWLIAGLNTKSSSELAEMDLNYFTKYFGLFFGVLGVILVLSPFLFNLFNVDPELRRTIFGIAIVAFVAFILLFFNVIKRKRIYKKKL